MPPTASGALTEIGFAKINLALHVRRRRADGYHELETLFAFAETGDRLKATPSERLGLTITGPFADGLTIGPDNLVLRAVAQLGAANGITPRIAFTLEKNLPIAAGIGGGSADAAAALRLAARFWGEASLRVKPAEIALSLGADVPACLVSQSCHGTGVGEHLSPLPGRGLAGLPILLVNPRQPCPTGPVFTAWDGVDRGKLDPDAWREGRNDLQAPACALVPVIGDVLSRLQALPGARLVRMSGSGATCFALFDTMDDAQAAAGAIARTRPNWWTLATRLR